MTINACVHFSTLILFNAFLNISNFVSNLILYILKYVWFLSTEFNLLIPWNEIAFLVGKQMTSFTMDTISESWVWLLRDRAHQSIAQPCWSFDSDPETLLGHASMDSICWKYKQAFICESKTDSDIWDLISIEKAQNTPGKIIIHMRMNAYDHFSYWFYSIHFLNISIFVL